MRRKLTAIILTLSMLVTMMPAVAMAESETSTTLQSQIDVAEGATTITLTGDVAEDITIAKGKDITLNLGGHTLSNKGGDTITVQYGGKLTVEGEGVVDNVTHAKAAIYNNGEVVLNNGTFDRSAETGAQSTGQNSYYTILNHGVMTINDGVKVTQNGNFSSMVANGYYNYTDTNARSGYVKGTNHANPSLTINGGNFSGGLNTIKNDDGAKLTIEGGTFTNVVQCIVQNHNIATINNGTFDGTKLSAGDANTASVVCNCGCGANVDLGEFTINGGTFIGGEAGTYVVCDVSSEKGAYTKITNGQFNSGSAYLAGKAENGTITISGGQFSSDPSACLAEGKTVTGQDAPYLFKVVDKTNDAAAEVVPAAPEAEVTLPENASKEDKALADSAAAAIAPKEGKAPTVVATNNMTAAASTLAAENNTTEADGEAALNEAGITVTDSDTVKIVVQPYVDIKVTDADATNKTMTLDITPMYQKVATTADAAKGDDIVVKKDDSTQDANAVVIDEPQELDVKGDVTVTIPLPAGFTNEINLYVGHEAKSGNYIYKGAVDEKGILTFTNPHGFSKFTVGAKPTMTNSSDANNVRYYDDFTTALNDAKDGETITLTDANATYTGTMTGDARSVKLTNNTEKDITVKINGDNIVVPAKGDVTYTYEKEVVSVKTYDIDIEAINGSVTASHKFAAKGATVTLTPVAKDGYKLDSINVCPNADGGDELELKALANGTFSFKMPACDVTVHASFVPEKEDVTLPFKDVDTDDWFYGDVAFVYENGIMSGMATDTFAPQTTTTRGMIVCMLHRMEGEVAPSGSNNFTDVTPGAYYENAITWASENGIVNGYSDTAFGPNDAITREQMAAILYRYAQYKNMDVSIGESTNILSYTDAQDVSSYAMKPMQWAVGSGLIGGMTKDTLVPQGQATRAQVAAIFHRFCTMDAK